MAIILEPVQRVGTIQTSMESAVDAAFSELPDSPQLTSQLEKLDKETDHQSCSGEIIHDLYIKLIAPFDEYGKVTYLNAFNDTTAMHVCAQIATRSSGVVSQSLFINELNRGPFSEDEITLLGQVANHNDELGKTYYQSDFYNGVIYKD